MEVLKQLSIDLSEKQNTPVVYAVQGEENSRKIRFLMFQNGCSWNIDTASNVLISYKKPDGHGGLYDVLENGEPAVEFDERKPNALTITLAAQVLNVPGEVDCLVSLHSGDAISSTFKIVIDVERNPGIDLVESDDYFSLSVAIDAAAKASENPVFLVSVIGDEETGFSTNNAGNELIQAIQANKLPVCYWENKNVYLRLSRYRSDSDVSFSAIFRSVEYYININPSNGSVRNSFINHIGYGSNGVYVGSDEPQNESVALWIDPTQEREGTGFVPAPTTAQVGQVMAVQAVDLSNRPIAWQPISVSGNGTIEISSSVFFVNVTENDGVLVADHYFEEISEILDKNQLVLCKYGNNEYRLISRVSNYVTFGNLTGAVNAQIRIGKKTAADPVAVVKTNLIPAPEQAKPGQVLGVKSVDSTGALITWGPVDLPSGGGETVDVLSDITLTETVSRIDIPVERDLYKNYAVIFYPKIDAAFESKNYYVTCYQYFSFGCNRNIKHQINFGGLYRYGAAVSNFYTDFENLLWSPIDQSKYEYVTYAQTEDEVRNGSVTKFAIVSALEGSLSPGTRVVLKGWDKK